MSLIAHKDYIAPSAFPPQGSPVQSGVYGQFAADPEEPITTTTNKSNPESAVTRKSAGRKYRYSNKYQKKILLDEFNEPYFAHEKDDVSIPVPLSLPQSLNEALDRKLDKIRNHPDINKRKEKLKKSRYIRQLLERDLKVIYREE